MVQASAVANEVDLMLCILNGKAEQNSDVDTDMDMDPESECRAWTAVGTVSYPC